MTGTYAKKHIHIETICQNIMSVPGFNELYYAYQTDASRETVREAYKAFIENYFDEENTLALSNSFSSKLINVLNSLFDLIS